MESRAKFLGHAIHPMLIVFPLGLLISAVLFDLFYLMTGNASLSTVAYWNIAGGVIGGLLATIFGLRDWLAIPEGTRAKAIGLWHGGGNVVVMGLFAIAWYLRRDDPAHLTSTIPFVLEVIAIGMGATTGWLGGELVGRLAVGVDPGAHLNSPSSLSDKPASASVDERPSVVGD
ncbi:MAG: DUF2231 domain-containing protein [Ardenticatenales bacterium]|nr:DUF2231 domain-containing protein [Ardenticatenales bacterium]